MFLWDLRVNVRDVWKDFLELGVYLIVKFLWIYNLRVRRRLFNFLLEKKNKRKSYRLLKVIFNGEEELYF